MTLVATLTQPLRARYTQDFDKNEVRRSRYGVYDTFQRDTASSQSIFSKNVKDLIKRSFGNSVVIPVLNAKSVTIGNVRSCTVAASENTSALVTLTFVTYAWGFTMTPSQHYNNDIDYRADYERKFEDYLIKFAETLDIGCYNIMNTNRNQVWNAGTLAQYPQTGNALQVPPSMQDDFYNVSTAIMSSMDFYGDMNVVANTFHQPLVNRFVNQGSGNDTNLSFQFMGYDWAYSNRVTNTAGARSTVFMSPKGTYAIENRNDPDAIAGHKAGDGTEWGQIELPLVDMTVGWKYNSKCADQSSLHAGTGGLTSTLVESFEFSTDVCYCTVYNSNIATRSNPIVKADMLLAEPTP